LTLAASPHSHTLAAAGQVISRLKLNIWGKPTTNHNESVGAYQKLFAITLIYLSVSFLLNTILAPYNDPSRAMTPPPFMFSLQVLNSIIHYAYLGLLIAVLWNLRSYIRQKYAIPEDETCSSGCEDLLCAVCCAHLSVAQMMRHTTDYETYNSTCCTPTGVAAHVPSIV
jgi:Cys-rich protein (TIGR01571 family)